MRTNTAVNVRLTQTHAVRLADALRSRVLCNSRSPVCIPVRGTLLTDRGAGPVELTINLIVEVP